MASKSLHMERLEKRELLAADPVISEFLSRNDGGIRDANGRSSDWIEIYNAGDAAVDLAGYRLTDSTDDRSKWVFPSVLLEPGQYLVVFASGQTDGDDVDGDGNLHTNFTLQRGGEYVGLIAPDGTVRSEYGTGGAPYAEQLVDVSFGIAQSLSLVNDQSDAWYWVPLGDHLGTSWTQLPFDPAANGFTAGKASLGYEGRPSDRVNFSGQFATELPAEPHGVYVRTEFDLRDARAISQLRLDLKYDNGFVAYLNNVQVAEENAPETLGWFSTALSGSRRDAAALEFAAFDLSDHLDALVDGTNVLAIHALNHVSDTSDILIVPRLTAGVSDMKAATGLEAKVGYMPDPTPGLPNSDNSGVYSGFVADTTFSADRGFYREPFQVEIATATPGAQIRYTLDGSKPTATTGQLYTQPITVSTTANLRAAAFQEDLIPTNVDTHTYVFLDDVIRQPAEIEGFPNGGRVWAGGSTYVPQDTEMDPDVVNDPAYRDLMDEALTSIPTMSITSDINDIFTDDGWYDGEDVEKPVSVEVLWPSHPGRNHQAEAGIESHSHDRLKRSLRLNFRREYGDSTFQTDLFQTAPLFGATSVDAVDRIILRAGNNRSWARIWNPDKTAYTTDEFYRTTQIAMSGYGMRGNFVHLYINGVYWGLYNPTERADRFFTSDYFGGNEDDWFAVNHGGPLSGDSTRYDYLRRTVARNDMSDPGNYAELQQYLDVEGFVDYLIINWWMAVSDWPQNNWYAGNRNESSPLGATPLRFFAWDGEWSWGQGGQSSSSGQAHVHADFRQNRSGGDLITQLWHTARQSDEFMTMFADHVYQHLDHDGALAEENAKARWMTLNDYVRDAVIAESARWGDSLESARQPTRTRDVDWQNEVNRVLGLMTGNNEVFIDALRRESFYPSIDPPVFDHHGGVVPSGVDVQLTNPNPNGIVYFTTDGSDPRLPGGAVSDTARIVTGTIDLTQAATIKARVHQNGEWSALADADFHIASPLPFRVTEINYNPHDANPVTGLGELAGANGRFEFIELTNTGDRSIDLEGVRLIETEVQGESQGIEFTFGRQVLAPGSYVVVVRDREAFQSRYGTSVRIADGVGRAEGTAGEYAGGLSRRGEQITLVDAESAIIQQFAYGTNGGWAWRANGGGSSLEVVDVGGNYHDSANWRASASFGGSPGAEGAAEQDTIVINEVLANSSLPPGDRIELRNTTAQDLDVGHWYVSNTAGDYFQAQIAPSTVIPAQGYVVLSPSELGFELDAAGGDGLWLVEADSTGRPIRFVDHVEYGVAARDVSTGPWPQRGDAWIALAQPTLGGPNSGPRVGDVVISEVYFDPADPDGAGPLRPDDFEFVEIYNRSNMAVDVSRWSLAGSVEFVFPENTRIEAGQTLLVAGFDPDRAGKGDIFRFLLSADPGAPLLGPYSRPLDDISGSLRLVRPDLPPIDQPGFIPMVPEDQVTYGSSAPWPTGTSGEGNSLARTQPTDHGELATSWASRPPSPGAAVFFERLAGDANEDGVFDRQDIVAVLQAGKYLTDESATWAEGDWTGDGRFDQLDLVAALVGGGYLNR